MASKRSRWRRRLLWAGAIYLAYALLGFFVLPPIIKSQLLKQLPAATRRHAEVRQVKFNPLALSLTIRGLKLTEPDGSVFASWEELYVNFQLSSLLRWAWTFDEIGLKQPYGHLSLAKDGRFNFANMSEDTPPAPPTAQKPAVLPRVNVWRLHIDDGRLVWDDQTHRVPQHLEFSPINLGLTNLTTRLGKDSQYSFRAVSDSGKSLSWAGTLEVQPFESRGHLELAGVELRRWTPILRDYLRAEMTDGRMTLRADYSVAAGTNGFEAAITNGVIEMAGLKVKDLNTGEIVTTLPSFFVGPADFDLQARKLHVARVALAGFSKIVRIEKDGSLNLNRLVEPPAPKPPATNAAPAAPAPPWNIAVDDFNLRDASISFTDLSRSTPFRTMLGPVGIRVRHFSTRPASDADYQFTIPTEAGEALSGKGTFCLAPLRSDGEVKLAALKITKYAPYFQDRLRGEVLAGTLGAGLEYRYAAGSNAPLVTVSNAGIALADFKLKAADGAETVVAIPSFTVERTEASLAQRSVQVGLVKSTGGSLLVRQKKDGTINLLGLMAPDTAHTAPAAESKPSEPPWTVLLKEIAFDNYALRLDDEKPSKPAALSLDQLAFDVKGVSTTSNAPVAAHFSARLNGAGTVALDGTGTITPLAADADLAVNQLDLRPFQPYLNESVRLDITSGRLDTRAHLRYAPPGASGPRVQVTGDIALDDLATRDQVLFKDFVKWDALELSGLELGLEPNRLQLREIKWRGLQASVIIGPDHRPNLETIMPEKASGQSAPATPAASAPPAAHEAFPLQLGALVLENASVHFSDESIEPHAAFDVQEFGGSVTGLSSDERSAATVALRGKVEAAAPFSISGKVSPLAKDLTLDLAVAFTNTDLTAFSTYLEKYAGHPLNKGKLSMDLHYDIQHKQLKAANKFLIEHFTLGPRNDSTNATHLPVKLAVALLKDRNGQINLDIPVAGRTDDPQFRVAPIIFKVVVNLLVKAATSPFSMLGALVGGGEELSFVEFAPGRSDIPQAEAPKLEKLVSALDQRPALNLEIAGSFDADKDGPALARAKLEQQLKVLRLRELAEANKPVPSLEALQLEPAIRERLLRQMLAELGTNETLVLRAAPVQDTKAMALAAGIVPGPTGQPAAPHTGRSRTARADSFLADTKGAAALTVSTAGPAAAGQKAGHRAQLPTAPSGAPLTLEQIEARLVGAIKVSEEERRDLIRHRAEAVQSTILKSGKIAAERLVVAMPKPAGVASKGECRANLSLE
ncbi:MAG TPA: DUF748 domain-containing protein [Candidatus Acidoferrum sp.]|nr:DUF748 domain-containing protein [Candidatus Acidoferrum sp.]